MKRAIMWIVIVIICLSFILTFSLPNDFSAATPAAAPAPLSDTLDPQVTVVTEQDEKALADQIVVNTPVKNSTVTSPLIVKGKARGSWYFEASFPIQLIDPKTVLLIAEGIATAEGDWMTSEFVPFTAELKFTKPLAAIAADLILRKDNPSGLSEHDASISIPVTVK